VLSAQWKVGGIWRLMFDVCCWQALDEAAGG